MIPLGVRIAFVSPLGRISQLTRTSVNRTGPSGKVDYSKAYREKEMNQIELLDAAKAVTGSDYKTAKTVGVSKQRISNARLRGDVLRDEILGQIGELIGKEPWDAICEVRLAHAHTFAERKIWRRWSGAAAIIMMTLAICATALPSTTYAAEGVSSVYYVK